MLQIPVIAFSLLAATIYAAVFQLVFGKTFRDLLFYWPAAAVGFASGQVVGYMLDLIPWTIGQIHIIEASVISILFLVLAYWLRQEKESA